MRLGELLLQESLITKEGLEEALAVAVIDVEFTPDHAQEAHRYRTEGVADAPRALGRLLELKPRLALGSDTV